MEHDTKTQRRRETKDLDRDLGPGAKPASTLPFASEGLEQVRGGDC